MKLKKLQGFWHWVPLVFWQAAAGITRQEALPNRQLPVQSPPRL